MGQELVLMVVKAQALLWNAVEYSEFDTSISCRKLTNRVLYGGANPAGALDFLERNKFF